MRTARPGVALWLWHALGGRLPERYHEWVLHDATTGTWVLRHAARRAVALAPLLLVWLLLPGSVWLRVALVLMATLVGFFYVFAYIEESCERRLAKHGYPPGTGKRIRAQRAAERQAANDARKRAKAHQQRTRS